MTESDVPLDAPAWMLALEKKRQRVHRLAHDVGAGSPCLQCKDDCPGLDLHFWRKICRNCKCKKEDHDVADDCGVEQFEILLGSSHSHNRPNKAFLEMLEKHTIAGLKSKAKNVAFDWVPPDVSPVIAAEYMQSLPACKLPISGSDGALYRRQQLERQLPLHDLDANQCHQLTPTEVENLNKYLENLKNNVVGQGRVSKLGFPTSSSLDSMQKISAFNSIPKPFQTYSGSTVSSDSSPKFTVGVEVNSDPGLHLKPPSAFWPKSLSPELPRSLSPSSSDHLPSVADRGAAFGVTLSPASKSRKVTGKQLDKNTSSDQSQLHLLKSSTTNQQFTGDLVIESTPKSLAQSTNVQGNLWVPAECLECSRRAVDGQLIRDQVCTHVANSNDVSTKMKPMECFDCIKRVVDGQILREQVGTHHSDPRRSCVMDPMTCSECLAKRSDGKLVEDQVSTQLVESSALHPQQPSECSQRSVDGMLISGKIGAHIVHDANVPHSAFPTDESVSVAPAEFSGLLSKFLPNHQQQLKGTRDPPYHSFSPLHESTNAKGFSPVRSQDWSKGFSTSGENTSSHAPADSSQGTTIRPPEIKSSGPGNENPNISRNQSPSNMGSSPGAPHMLALYAHNAFNSTSSLDPQDTISPQIASMTIDEGSQHGVGLDVSAGQSLDAVPPCSVNLGCIHCKGDILPGEVVVFADRAGADVIWHPKCFVCNTCQELLVDLVYFFNKGHVYCGRHYAEILDIPRCSACDELIFVKEYTVAEGQAFHVKHFCCFECDTPLGGKQYVPKDTQPVCLPCYEQKYGKVCETCHLVIKAQDQGVTWKELHWHATPECFCCNHCKVSLLGGRFAVKDQCPYCCKECMQAGTSKHQKVSAL